jgi:uncharacterized protein
MKFLSGVAAIAIAASLGAPALARDTFVQDGASMFGSSTVTSLNQTIGDFNRTTGKEVVVVTVPSLDGATVQDAAEKAFATQQVNGVLIFLAKTERKDLVVPDRAAASFFPRGTTSSISAAMRGYFRSGDYDEGITTGVNLVIDQYRSHERVMPGAQLQRTSYTPSTSSFGGGMSLFWIILILIAGFLIIRAIFRAMAGPRMMPPGYGGPGGPGYGGPGYGGPGYGGGYGGGGGGSFFSGLLGGLGGAFLGNELFNRGGGGGEYMGGGMMGGDTSGVQQPDSSGWQSDAGQADMGNAGGGDWGSSGGGFGGDSGGGFGGDGGGGGGDGGGW